jgi:transcription antitermination factor NusG
MLARIDSCDAVKTERASGKHWYVVHVAGTSDATAAAIMKRIGWEVYQPKCKELRAIPQRQLPPRQRKSGIPVRKPVDVPLFPRYPFIHADLSHPLRHEVFALLGVRGLICDASSAVGRPAPIDDAIIYGFKAREVDGAIPLGLTVRDLAYSIGDQVRIAGGPFAGHNAVIEQLPDVPIDRLDDQARIKLLIGLFGRMVVVEVSLADIEKL